MKGHGKACRKQPHHKETGKAHLVHVLRVEKEVWDAQVFAKIAGDHSKENDPAQD